MDGLWSSGSPKLESQVSQVADLNIWSCQAQKPRLREYKQLQKKIPFGSPPGEESLEGLDKHRSPNCSCSSSGIQQASFLPQTETLGPRTFLSVPLVVVEGTLPSPMSKPVKTRHLSLQEEFLKKAGTSGAWLWARVRKQALKSSFCSSLVGSYSRPSSAVLGSEDSQRCQGACQLGLTG